MAIIKYCDNCKTRLGGEKPFLQMKGRLSDQYEPDDAPTQFRYLTYGDYDETHTYCDEVCELEWREKRRAERPFRNQARYEEA